MCDLYHCNGKNQFEGVITMDETVRFIIGITLFAAVITYEWLKGRSDSQVK